MFAAEFYTVAFGPDGLWYVVLLRPGTAGPMFISGPHGTEDEAKGAMQVRIYRASKGWTP